MEDGAARVGIVIRTKNRPALLARALEDVLNQTFAAWRILVVNDGGERALVDRVLGDFAARLQGRGEALDAPLPGGRCAAANAGLRITGTEYVVLHDDDDLWNPDFLKETVAWLDEHPEDAGVMVATEIVYESLEDGHYVEKDRVPFWRDMTRISYLDMLTVNRAVPISFLYRASLHGEVGYYDETLEAVEDWEFYLRVLPAHRIGFIPGPALAFWTQRPDTTGSEGNSMFALGDIHGRSDELVRDRALREFVQRFGPGIPLYLARLEADAEQRQREWIREEMRRQDPLRRILRRLRWRR